MTTKNISDLLIRELNLLKKEIEAYSNEENLWKVADGITNSAGNLALHLIGNLNTYIGAELGKTGYIRNREAEFADKNIPKAVIIADIEKLIPVISTTLSVIKEKQLSEKYPLLVFKEKAEIGFFLIHLHGHLTYHLGQINYHRRLLDN
ncbi:Protein of unknown function [Spirosomataceae bacterium TFI 002]|nr:Protein of unknown function [Spirosomataceae bacterium TFI 002]